MTTIGSTTTDDGSFGPDDFSDGESSTITSESQQGSLSSRDTIHLGHQHDDNDRDHHQACGVDTSNQTHFRNIDNNERVTDSSAPMKHNGTDAYLSLTVTNSSAASSAKSSSSSEEKSIQRVNCRTREDDEEEDDDSQCTTERFFIVKSTYPKYSKWDSTDPEIAESERRAKTIHEIVPPNAGFESEFHAEFEARKVRNECEAFRGACAPLDDGGEFSEFEDDYHFNSFDEPPWDSEVLEECDREEEVIIDCMTLKQFNQKLEEKTSDEEYIEYMDKEFKCEETLQVYECKLRVRDSGCSAYYSYPTAQPWDIKAEMEVRESTNHQKDAARKMRPEIECVKSFMFKGRQHGVFGYLLESCHHCDYDNEDVSCDRQEVQMYGLLRHLQAAKSLRELFIQLNRVVPDNLLQRHKLVQYAHVVNKTFIHKLVYVAPHLDQLRVLSFGPNITLYPRALEAISKCLPSLERLDISFALSMEFAPQGDDDVTKYYPYENPLLACVTELDRLHRLDLGFEMVDFRYTDSKGRKRSVKKSRISCLISEVALQEIRETLFDVGGIVTETHTTKPPPWEEEESDKRMRALQEMMMDPQLDNAIRETAMEKYQELKEYLMETSNVPDDRQHQSNLELLLEASGRCNAIEEARLHEQQQHQKQRSPPAKDAIVERESSSAIAISETSDNVGTDPHVDTHVNDEDIHTINDVEEQPSTPNSKKRISNVTVDDAVNSKRFCL
mmetsp:Transcript_4755/g.7352  ORF Transcript_4755/g.7352 Transcript_4755/m.7352 type:complete len:728 (+) Transcript_4755:261-2444(+)